MTNKTFTPDKRFIALMASLTGLTAFGIDAVLPIFPEIIDYYQLPHAEHNRIQQMVFVYMLGFSIFQLLFGVLADTVGRKPLMQIGIGVYSLAAIAVIFIDDFDNVLVARFIQGAGLAAPRVLSTTIVRDVSSGREMSRIMSFITLVFLAVPAIAPMLGQAIVLFAPWQTVFVMLTLFGVVLMGWTHLSMPETLTPENRRPLSLSQISAAVREFMSHRETLAYLLMISMMFGGLMMYIGQAEQILQKDVYQLGKFFPFAFAAIVLGMMSAALTNAKIVMRIGLRTILRTALVMTVVTDVLFLLLTLAGSGHIPLWMFILILIVHFYSFGLLMPNLNTLALAPYHHIAGTASALIGMITSVVGLAIAQVFSQFYNGTLYAIVSGFVVCMVIMIAAYGMIPKARRKAIAS